MCLNRIEIYVWEGGDKTHSTAVQNMAIIDDEASCEHAKHMYD